MGLHSGRVNDMTRMKWHSEAMHGQAEKYGAVAVEEALKRGKPSVALAALSYWSRIFDRNFNSDERDPQLAITESTKAFKELENITGIIRQYEDMNGARILSAGHNLWWQLSIRSVLLKAVRK